MPKGKKKEKPEAEKEPSKKMGRPTKYSEALAKRICKLVATKPHGLIKLCAENDWMPVHTTINEWRWEYDDFSTQYTKAKIKQAELLAEDCIDIADDTSRDSLVRIDKNGEEHEVCNTEWVNRSRLRVDTRKWLAAKLVPRIYGEAKRVEELEGQNDVLKAELRELREELDAKHKKEY
jgi:hypothetical protein